MFSLYKKELRSYYCSPFAYIIAALFLLVFSLSFINGISNLSGHQFKFSFPNVFYNNIWSSLICGYLGFFLWGLVCIAVGMLMSSFTESPIIAGILGEGAMIILIFIDNFKDSGLFTNLPKAAQIIGSFSTQERFVSFSQGLFSIADLIFFITSTVLFVGFTIISVEKRRWSRG